MIIFVQTEKSGLYHVRNFGYLKPSRLHNIDWCRHKQQDDIYINFDRNGYHDEEYRAAVRSILQGKAIYTADRDEKVYMESLVNRNLQKQREAEKRGKKSKKRI